ncbi:MAG: hypothetical protein ACM3N9_06175 [Syntrophothermus sp.]
MEENTPTSSKRNLILVAILVAAIVLLLVFLFIQRRQLTGLVKEKETEKIALQHELDSVIVEHNKTKELYGALSDSLSRKDSVIQANAIEIRKLLDTEWEYQKIRKKLGQLQKIAQNYVRQMDSLYTVNRELQAENEKIRQDYRNEQNKSSLLVKDKEALNEKISQAAYIKAYDVRVTPLKLKGGEKETPTDKASRTDRLKVCFTLGENKLVKAGKISIYVRITRPDNVVVIKSKYDTFQFNGQNVPFSLREDVTYQGDAVPVCVTWTKKDNDKTAMKGKYTVTVFTEEREIGSGSFELK